MKPTADMDQQSVSFFVATELESPITEFALLLVGGDGRSTMALGSAVFIARELAISAKHVIEEYWNQFGSSYPFAGEKPLTGHFALFAVQYPGSRSDAALWRVEYVWAARFTDIAFLSLRPANEIAEGYQWHASPHLDLLPPAVGEQVVGFGYAASQVQLIEENQLRMTLNPTTTGGLVNNVFPEYRDRGMLKFPCFEINAHFIGGMSGGPLFNKAGQLCGLICASMNGQPIAYGATLWPAMGTTITHQGPGMVCKGPYPVFEMADHGLLHAKGWSEAKEQFEVVSNPFGEERLQLKRPPSQQVPE